MAEYIEREAFLDAIERMKPYQQDVDDIAEMLQNFHSADVRPVVRSHWFDGACVNCGFKPALDYEYATVYDDYNEYRWNYCPNCGAAMREES